MKKVFNHRTNSKNLILAAAAFFAAAMVVFPSVTESGSKSAIVIWANAIVPVLLPFFIFADFIKRTGNLQRLPVQLYPLLIAVLSGYPMGAKIVGDLVGDGTRARQGSSKLQSGDRTGFFDGYDRRLSRQYAGGTDHHAGTLSGRASERLFLSWQQAGHETASKRRDVAQGRGRDASCRRELCRLRCTVPCGSCCFGSESIKSCRCVFRFGQFYNFDHVRLQGHGGDLSISDDLYDRH